MPDKNKIKAAGITTCIWIVLSGLAYLITYHFAWFVGLLFVCGTLFLYHVTYDFLRDG